jgi:polyisoprenoid-binding protein YceI
MKNKIIIALSIIAVLIAAAFITLKIMTKNAQRNVATEKAINLTAIEFASIYKNYEDSANKLYLNKTIQLTGIISTISENQNSQTDAIIMTSDSLPAINCTIDGLYKSINAADTITLKGICTGILTNINLVNCIVVESKKYIGIILSPKKDTIKVQKIDTSKNQKNINPTSYNTSKAQIILDGGAGLEDIKATNNHVDATITTNGKVKFKLALLAFTFSDALMQQHFNEEYVESKKFPTATFVGTINNITKINFTKNGNYKAEISGTLTLHGVNNPIKTAGTIIVNNQKISAQSSFSINMNDYNIPTDAAKSVNLSINCIF